MSEAQNKQVIERCFAAYCNDDMDVLDAAAAPDYTYHDPAQPAIRTWSEHKAQLRGLRQSIPDLRFEIDELLVDGDRVAVRWTMRGTHQGKLLGLPATGRAFETKGHSLYHLVDGRVAVAYSLSDLFGLQRQLAANKA